MKKLVSDQDIRIAICRAAINWHEWRDCFEHPDSVGTLPVLADSNKFGRFCHEYGLRWIGNDLQKEQFRKAILKSNDFMFGINGKTEERLVKAMNSIKDSFGRRQLSAISKLAAFAAPDYYVAYDQFSRNGLAQVSNIPAANLESYPVFLKEVAKMLDGPLGTLLKENTKHHPAAPKAKYREAFLRRAADCILMTIGGRWPNPKEHEYD